MTVMLDRGRERQVRQGLFYSIGMLAEIEELGKREGHQLGPTTEDNAPAEPEHRRPTQGKLMQGVVSHLGIVETNQGQLFVEEGLDQTGNSRHAGTAFIGKAFGHEPLVGRHLLPGPPAFLVLHPGRNQGAHESFQLRHGRAKLQYIRIFGHSNTNKFRLSRGRRLLHRQRERAQPPLRARGHRAHSARPDAPWR